MVESNLTILVTGATGFVGQALISHLLSQNKSVRATVRESSSLLSDEVEQYVIGDLSVFSKKMLALKPYLFDNIDTIIHCAARVHVMNDDESNSLSKFRKVNHDATMVLACMAADAGVKRFVFLSSISAHLIESAFLPEPMRMTSCIKATAMEKSPSLVAYLRQWMNYIAVSPYGLSKYEAEKSLLALVKETAMEVVIIRPPLVYGPRVKAKFALMVKWVGKGIPLPFGTVHNKRSLVALDNVVDFIVLCADRKKSPKAANQVFLISDGEDVSSTQLLRKIAKAHDKQIWLIPIPVSWMTFVAKILGKGDVANSFFGSLQVDSSKAHNLLGWKPIITMDEQLKKMVKEGNSEKSI